MTPLTQTLAALDEAATGGRWEVAHQPMPYTIAYEVTVRHELGDTVCCWPQEHWQYEYPPQLERIEADAQLIATLRNALPALLELVAAVRADVEESTAEFGAYCYRRFISQGRWTTCGNCAACRVVAALRAVEGEGT